MVNCKIWPSKYHGELRNLALKISWWTAKLTVWFSWSTAKLFPPNFMWCSCSVCDQWRKLNTVAFKFILPRHRDPCNCTCVRCQIMQASLLLVYDMISLLQYNYSFRTRRGDLNMSEPTPHGTTWTFKSNDGTRPRYLSRCFVLSCKIVQRHCYFLNFSRL